MVLTFPNPFLPAPLLPIPLQGPAELRVGHHLIKVRQNPPPHTHTGGGGWRGSKRHKAKGAADPDGRTMRTIS